MADSQDILLTFQTDTGEVTKSLSDIQKGLEGVDSQLDKTSKNTSKIGTGLKAAGKLGATGFKALGTACSDWNWCAHWAYCRAYRKDGGEQEDRGGV